MADARIRKPLYTSPKPAEAARPYADDPSGRTEAMYRQVWETSMHDMPFVNNALTVAAIGFHRYQGDWVGAVLTPWFLNLFVLPGGGTIWTDQASGDRVRIAFPVGELEFIADYQPEADVPAYQYCPLFAPVSQFLSQDAAVAAAEAALAALFVPPVTEAENPPPTEVQADVPSNEAPEDAIPSRRAFFRGLAGRRS